MTKLRKQISDINEKLENIEIISNRDTFRVLSMLTKNEVMSFSQLKNRLNLNPNSLQRCLRKLSARGLIENYYEKKEDKRIYSFYKISSKGRKDLYLNIGMPRIWEILKEFKDLARAKGWGTSESEDWIEINDNYHGFLWAKDIQPSSFKSIVSNRRCIVREGLSYHVVEASYTAWLFSEKPSESIFRMVYENSDYSKRTALFDLSEAYLARPIARKFNKTDSRVFQEFENFLESYCNINIKDAIKVEQSCLLEDVRSETNNHI